jgi:hypothetical protein
MKRKYLLLFFIVLSTGAAGQHKLRPVAELVNNREPAWPFILQMIDSATNKVEVIAADTAAAKDALFKAQVSTRSPMGAIIFNTGGIMIDGGWIRILGSGSSKLPRSLPDWNKGKTFKEFGDPPPYLLIADDAVGGYFAVNSQALGNDKWKIYYLSPDRLVWEPLGMTYTEFLFFCFRDNLEKFYAHLRWNGWQKDVRKLAGNKVFSFHPYLWTTEGKDVNKNKRTRTPADEQFRFNLEMRKQLNIR